MNFLKMLFADEESRDFMIFLGLVIFFPAFVGGVIGGCVANSARDITHPQLHDYATAVSNRLDRVEFGLSLLAIPVQRKANATLDEEVMK